MNPFSVERQYRRIQRWKKLIPEVEAYTEQEDCVADWKAVVQRRYVWHMGLIVSLLSALGVLLVAVSMRILGAPSTLSPWGGALGGIMAGSACSMSAYIFRSRIRRALREALRQRGIPVCRRCAYNLTGNTSGVCPECGERISALSFPGNANRRPAQDFS